MKNEKYFNSLGSEMKIKTNGGEEWVMEIWAAVKGFTGLAH